MLLQTSRTGFLLTGALALAVVASGGPQRATWPGKPYKEVRAYLYNLASDWPNSIIEDGRLSPSVENPDGVRLTDRQVERLLDAVARPHPDHPIAACFSPRHGFVFYNASKKPVAWVYVCFECSNYRGSPELKNNFDLDTLEKLTRELGLPVLSGRPAYEAWKKKQAKQQ